MALPIGYLLAPAVAGVISDNLMNSARRPMIMLSCGVSALALVALALAPATNLYLGATLLLVGGFALSMTPMAALAVDMAGRHIAGTSSGLLDAHGYFYAGLQAIIFGVVLDVTGSPWPAVFLGMAATRVLSAAMISFVKV
jgi:sugar phosphate permease